MFKSQLIDTFVVEKPDNISYINWLLTESYKKTSFFMAFPFFIYAVKSNKKEDEIESLKDVGKNIGILYQTGDDLFDMNDDIKTGTLALTYPLAYIMDNEEILNNEEIKFIKKILEIKFLDTKNAKNLNSIYIKHKDVINDSAKDYFNEYFEKIKNSDQINSNIKDIIIELLQKIINPGFWQYRTL